MKILYDKFPRAFGSPRRKLVKDEESFYELVNAFNGIKNVYSSVYDCDEEGNYDKCKLNKLFFDFDESDCIYDVVRFSEYLEGKNIKHTIIFSGKKGFHVYIFTKGYSNFKYSLKEVITNAHTYFINLLNITADKACVGDIKRIARVPNTWHMSGGRYCRPMQRASLKKGWEHVKERAKKQKFKFWFYGEQLLDLKQFDFACKRAIASDIPEFNYNGEVEIKDAMIKTFLPCVQSWLLEPEFGTWEARYYFACYCRVLCFPKSVCDKLARKHFSKMPRKDSLKNNYNHFVMVKALDYAYSRDITFPNCSSLFSKGLCKGRCKLYKKGGSPLYK